MSRLFPQLFSKFLSAFLAMFIDDARLVTYKTESTKPQFPITKRFKRLIGTSEGFTEDFCRHMSAMKRYLQEADAAGIMLKLKKFVPCATKFTYLGLNVNLEDNSIGVLPSRLPYFDRVAERIKDLTQAELATCLGTMSFMSSSLEGFASKSALLFNATAGPRQKSFKMNKAQRMCLRELLVDVQNLPKRYLFSSELPLDVWTDSSIFAAAACITQTYSGRRNLIGYYSWKHDSTTQRISSSARLELIPIILVIKKCYAMLLAAKEVIFHSDCLSLIEAMKRSGGAQGPTSHDRLLSIILNMPFKFRVVHVDASAPPLATVDAISRDPRLRNVQQPRYFCRHSNRLYQKNPDEVAPGVWRPNQLITTSQILKELKRTHAFKFPKTDTKHALASQEDDDALLNLEAFEAQLLRDLLPRIDCSATTYRQAKLNPMEHFDDASSLKSFDSSRTGLSKVKADDENSISEEQIAAAFGSEENGDEDPIVVDERFHDVLDAQCAMVTASLPLNKSTSKDLQEIRSQIFRSRGHGLKLAHIAKDQASDPVYGPIIRSFKDGTVSNNNKKKYELHLGIYLVKKTKTSMRIVLPLKSAVTVIAVAHLIAHTGIAGLYDNLKMFYYFPHMREIIASTLSSCAQCRLIRPNNQREAPRGHVFRAARPFQCLSMDFVSMTKTTHRNRVYEKLLVIVCVFSHYAMIFPTAGEKASEVAKILEMVLGHLPPIESMSSDGGPGLCGSKAVREVLAMFGISASITLPNNPTSHSLVEAINGKVRHAILTHQGLIKSTSWVLSLPLVNLSVNSMVRTYNLIQMKGKKEIATTVKTTPLHIAFGCDALADVREILGPTIRNDPNRLKTLNVLQERMAKYFRKMEEELAKEDEDCKQWTRITSGSLVMLKRIPVNKNKTYYYNNLYLVKERNGRKCVITSVLKEPFVYSCYIGHLKICENSDLLKLLTPSVRKLFGGYLELKQGDRSLPFDLKSEISDTPPTRLTRLRRRQTGEKLVRVPATGWTLDDDSSSDDEDDRPPRECDLRGDAVREGRDPAERRSTRLHRLDDHLVNLNNIPPFNILREIEQQPAADPTSNNDTDSDDEPEGGDITAEHMLEDAKVLHRDETPPQAQDESQHEKEQLTPKAAHLADGTMHMEGGPQPKPTTIGEVEPRRRSRRNLTIQARKLNLPIKRPANAQSPNMSPIPPGLNTRDESPLSSSSDSDGGKSPTRHRRPRFRRRDTPTTSSPQSRRRSLSPSKLGASPSFMSKVAVLSNARNAVKNDPMKNTRAVARHFATLPNSPTPASPRRAETPSPVARSPTETPTPRSTSSPPTVAPQKPSVRPKVEKRVKFADTNDVKTFQKSSPVGEYTPRRSTRATKGIPPKRLMY